MYIVLICALAICVNHQRLLVLGQEVGSDYGTTSRNHSRAEDATSSAPQAAGGQTCPFWSGFADYVTLRDGTIKVLDAWRKLWNSGVTLKLGIHKNYQNDTVLDVGFDNSLPSDSENEGKYGRLR